MMEDHVQPPVVGKLLASRKGVGHPRPDADAEAFEDMSSRSGSRKTGRN